MNTYPLIAIGVTSLNSKKQQLDVRYLLIVNKDSQILNPLRWIEQFLEDRPF